MIMVIEGVPHQEADGNIYKAEVNWGSDNFKSFNNKSLPNKAKIQLPDIVQNKDICPV